MEKPAVIAPASGPTIAPKAACAAFRDARKAAGWTQEGLSRAAGLSSTYVKKLELGRLPHPTQATRRALADALGVAPEVLFAGFPAPPVERHRAERRELVEQLLTRGETIPAVAAKLKVSWSTVGRDAEALAISPLGPDGKMPTVRESA